MDAHSPGAMMRRKSLRLFIMFLLLSSVIGLVAAYPIFSHSAAYAATTLLSQGKLATASSIEGGFTAASAVDGDTGTRWASAFSDPQWLQIDLGVSATISQVVLQWETAYGKAYQIQVSNDATTWTTIYSTTIGDGAFDDFNVTGSGRYVRLYATQRGTSWGYALWEFGIYS